jgi:glycosyltransferase involved in cell wall biosynthesis
MVENSYTQYSSPREIPLDQHYPVIWLASWYPSCTEPVNGDFIQRHAIAVAEKLPLLLIHTIHDPYSATRYRYESRRCGGLQEILIYFRHSGKFPNPIERVLYNLRFHRLTLGLLEHVFDRCGIPQALHVHVPVKMGRIAMAVEKKWNVPYLVSEQSGEYQPGIPDGFSNRNPYYRLSVRRILHKARAISNVSEEFSRILGGMSGGKPVTVIRNLADTEQFRHRPNTDQMVFTFIHVSTLKPQKNVDGILRTAAKLRKLGYSFRLVMVGGEDERVDLYRQAWRGADWLDFRGQVDHREVPALLQMAHCLVMFSQHENFPCVIPESLCCGLPVITSDAGGCAEAIDQTNGIVVSREDEEALLLAMEHIISAYDQYHAEEISRKAASLYGHRKIAADFLDFYKALGIIL